MTKILIASPSYDGNVRKEFMRSIMVLTDYFRHAGIEWDMRIEQASLLHVMRSVMASKALLDEGTTHLLFIDTDMEFSVSAIRKLIAAGKDVIGCASPYRTIPLHEPVKEAGKTFRQAISQAVPYAVRLLPGTALTVERGICEVASIGTGIVLISTEALGRMRDSGAVGRYQAHFPYTQWFGHENYFGFFEPVVVDGTYLGEDYSFCRRWSERCGGKVYAVVDEEIGHYGPMPVLGRYLDQVRARQG
ncbi:MAG TPA: hypothetical protein VHA82_22615 [Ramlibacter sp.]|uniref:hypothetical protein n=1 Tax=Ramlibacter sp. TaxID=1917967 RepID=UPI002C45FE1A|nr:hypothetical protein [Ramlibacter sp.]HVZ46616.1 hypothetical protein [Ramlibacter sp.]